MNRFLLFIGFLIPFFKVMGQTLSEDIKIYTNAEQMPQFPGGQDSMFAYLAKNIHYPPQAVNNNEAGVVFVNFIVEQTGKITKPEVLKGVTPTLDAEATRVISKMPAWQAGKQNGQPVAVKMTLPVRFQIKTNVSTDSTSINVKIEEQPEFLGGTVAMMKFIKSNIRYPSEAKKNRIEGQCKVSFVVNTDGSLSDFKVVRPLGYGLDEEAIRVLQTMPLWKPGKQNGQPVRVKFTLPVLFQL